MYGQNVVLYSIYTFIYIKKVVGNFLEMTNFVDRKFENVWRSEMFPFSAVVNFP